MDSINAYQSVIGSCAELIDLVQQVGFLPLLNGGVDGFSAEECVADDCRYHTFPDGGWEWPLWDWKGQAVGEGSCVYGKFFDKKAGFVARQWWPHLLNYRRSKYGTPPADSIEGIILDTLRVSGSVITRELRSACGFDGKGMRSKFDAYVTRLQMACLVVIEDFVYPTDRHGNRYGWGWALLTTPEQLYGHDACHCSLTPDESYQRLHQHLAQLLPQASERQLARLLG